eukprot:s1674_g20.t1
MWLKKDLSTLTRSCLRAKSTSRQKRSRKAPKAQPSLWDDEKWLVRKEFTRVRHASALQKQEDVYKLTAEMRSYLTCISVLGAAHVEAASPGMQQDELPRRARLFSSDQTLAALILLSALKGADVQLLPSSFRAMEHELHMRPNLLGLMALAQGVACAVTGPIWGNLVDSGASRKLLLKVGTGLWGLCTFQLAKLGRHLAFEALLTWLDLSTSDDAGQICGKVYCAANFGQVLACLIVVPISEHRIFGVMGWRICLLVVLLVEAAVEDLPRINWPTGTWDPKRFGLTREFHKLAKFLRLGSFRVIILQGVFGTIPGAAQTFTTMYFQYFQYLTISNHMCGLIIAMRTVGEGIGGALGGYLGDAANAKNHRYGRTWVAMFSVTASIPFLYVVYMGIPREASLSLLFAGILFTMGLVTTWEVMDIIPRRDLSSAFSWDVAIVFASGNTIGPLLVGFIAQDIFDYHYTSEKVENMSLEVREHNASALGRAIFFSCVVPSLISAVNFALLFWTYPADKEYRKNGMDPFFHRKSDRVVLAVLHVENGGQARFARGINSEVSLPTGSICAERAAIANARTLYPGIMRKQMKGIAVLDVPATVPGGGGGDPVELQNPLPPCGACREWLNKIQEESPGFYVLTFEDLSLDVVHERFLFWSQEETEMAKKDLGPWTCSQCGHENIPLSAICGQCHVDRFSMSYLRAPKKRVFYNIIQALSAHGPMTPQQLEARLQAKGTTPKAIMTELKLLQRSPKGSNSILRLDTENRFHVTETGQQFLSRRQKHWPQKHEQESLRSTSHLLLSRPEPCVQLDHASSRMPGDREREEERAGSFVWTRERKQNRLHLSDVNQALRHAMRKIRLFIICCCFVGSSCILAVTSRTDAAKAEFSCRCLQQQETQQRTLVKASIKLRAAMSKSPEEDELTKIQAALAQREATCLRLEGENFILKAQVQQMQGGSQEVTKEVRSCQSYLAQAQQVLECIVSNRMSLRADAEQVRAILAAARRSVRKVLNMQEGTTGSATKDKGGSGRGSPAKEKGGSGRLEKTASPSFTRPRTSASSASSAHRPTKGFHGLYGETGSSQDRPRVNSALATRRAGAISTCVQAKSPKVKAATNRPQTGNLGKAQQEWPGRFRVCSRAYPMFFSETRTSPGRARVGSAGTGGTGSLSDEANVAVPSPPSPDMKPAKTGTKDVVTPPSSTSADVEEKSSAADGVTSSHLAELQTKRELLVAAIRKGAQAEENVLTMKDDLTRKDEIQNQNQLFESQVQLLQQQHHAQQLQQAQQYRQLEAMLHAQLKPPVLEAPEGPASPASDPHEVSLQ